MVTTSKQERVYRIVRKRIVDGTLRPGSRLVADALARELDDLVQHVVHGVGIVADAAMHRVLAGAA
ncbi:MAG: hypothetical protein ACKN9D_18905, partial [Actinomycetales bacterium]